MKTSLWLMILGVVTTTACGDDRTEVSCGNGDAVSIDGQVYCVFEQAVVVENGFECPPDAPFLTRSTGFGVCGQQQMLPPTLIEDIHLGWQDLRGTCVLSSECSSGQSCIAAVCQTTPDPTNNQNNTNNPNNTNNQNNTNNPNNTTCATDDDCLTGEQCIDGQCIPSSRNCGGFAGLTCAVDEWCNYGGVDGQCGAADQLGTCEPRPEVCTDEFMPVCACNGLTYSNTCDAHAAGFDIGAAGECP